MSCGQKCGFFCKSACNEQVSHKCKFCVSLCSVFIVVLAILIMVTITGLGPLIFVRLSEKSVG